MIDASDHDALDGVEQVAATIFLAIDFEGKEDTLLIDRHTAVKDEVIIPAQMHRPMIDHVVHVFEQFLA
jgi:hypothetical protein